jgi:hypothetical protein
MPRGSPIKHTSTWMVTSTSKMSDLGPQKIQGIPLPTHCIQRELKYGVHYRALEYPIPWSSMVQSLLIFTAVCWVMNLSLSWSFQQDGVRSHTSNAVLRFLFDVFEDKVLLYRYPALFEEGFSRPPTSPDLNPVDYILWGYLNDSVFQKNPNTIPDLTLPSNQRLKPFLQKL